MKYKDLDEKNQQKLTDIIYNKDCDSKFKGSLSRDKIDGLCNSCTYFEFAESEFNIIFSYCKCFDIKIKKVDPVLECTSYNDKNIMSLDDMKDIAYLIDNTEKKIGF